MVDSGPSPPIMPAVRMRDAVKLTLNFVTGHVNCVLLSLRAQRFHRLGGGGAACRQNAGNCCTYSESDNGASPYQWIVAAHLEELRCHQMAGHDCQWNADQQANGNLQERSAEHHGYDVHTVCAERHAYSDFGGATNDAVSGQ